MKNRGRLGSIALAGVACVTRLACVAGLSACGGTRVAPAAAPVNAPVAAPVAVPVAAIHPTSQDEEAATTAPVSDRPSSDVPVRGALEWIPLIGGRSTTAIAAVAPGFEPARFGGNGAIEESESGLRLDGGAPLTGVVFPPGQSTVLTPSGEEYELEVVAARLAGTDFFCALTFPVADAALTLVLGGWGGSTCGFSCLDGRDAANNPTTTWRRFDKGVFVNARVRVTRERIEAFVDDAPLCSTPRAGVRLSLRPEVEPCRPLGIASYATTAMVRTVRWRPIRPTASVSGS
jgi:hypothetical protein